MTDRRAEPLTATRTLESQIYQQAIDQLRARGCRCMLVWNGTTAVPHTLAEAIDCVVNHGDGDSGVPNKE